MRKLSIQNLKKKMTITYQGAQAYDWSDTQPLAHLVFTYGSALFVDGFYETEAQQVRRFAEALIEAYKADPKFVWQYGAWMRDPVEGKGNRVQGSLVPALLDALLDETEHTEEYVMRCLRWRADDVIAFYNHYFNLSLGRPSDAARRGVARALAQFDEYQLMKYAAQKEDVRLCDVIAMVRRELTELGDEARHALDVGAYLHASSRRRRDLVGALPLTSARRALFSNEKAFARDPRFGSAVAEARVTWEQVLGHFGMSDPEKTSEHAEHNRAIWQALLDVDGLLPDMALLRNVRNMTEANIPEEQLTREIRQRDFSKIWPHQVYAGAQAVPTQLALFEEVFKKTVAKLPEGRHLGIGDASGSMCIKVGGAFSTVTCMDVAFCLTGLMSETSGLGASFSDSSWFGSWGSNSYLSIAERNEDQGALEFSFDSRIRSGMGGTQVFGAVLELITYLKKNDHIEPPDCLWFFSDMQFHPAAGVSGNDKLPKHLLERASKLGMDRNAPPLELALKIYREEIGPVDVVLWNLAAYEGTPVPADMPGVLLVSGFDANTLGQVGEWRRGALGDEVGKKQVSAAASENQKVILETIRRF